MKKILAMLMGMAFIITFGLEFAEDMSGPQGTGDKIIRDEDIQRLEMDQDRATVNQMPAESGTAGSGAGGVSKDSDSTYKDSDWGKAPVEKTPAKRGVEGSGAGGSSNDSYTPSY
jgi:hypothetical protein